MLLSRTLTQLRESQWFFTLDLQLGFWLIKMAFEDIHKSVLITKSRLFDWIVMLFDIKNATNTFSKTMTEVFGTYMDKIFKVFVDDMNVHNMIWEKHLERL
jgi:hypothetical protein